MVVKPRDGTVKQGWADPAILNIIRHVPRTSEDKLVPAVLAGSVDVTSLPLPPSTFYDLCTTCLSFHFASFETQLSKSIINKYSRTSILLIVAMFKAFNNLPQDAQNGLQQEVGTYCGKDGVGSSSDIALKSFRK